MDYDSSNKFISSLAKFLQSLCNGYVEFDNGVHVIGHLYLSVDTGKTIDYVLNEKVCKTDENSVTFISNSFHAEPAERPKPQGKRGPNDSKTDDSTSNEQVEPRSTNNGTIPAAKSSGQNSPHSGVKRPHSPSQRREVFPLTSGKSSPKYRKGPSDSIAPHPGENSISSDTGQADVASHNVQGDETTQESEYGEAYSESYFTPADEDNSLGETDRDVKPSLDTDVTFIKEEYGPNCTQPGNQGRDRNQGEDQTIFPSNQSFSSMQYSGQPNYTSPYGGHRSSLNPSGDRSSGIYTSGAGSSQLEPGENVGDPSGNLKIVPESAILLRNQLGMYVCDTCNRQFPAKREYEGHMFSHHLNMKPFSCVYCPKSFVYKKGLAVHLKLIHGIFNI